MIWPFNLFTKPEPQKVPELKEIRLTGFGRYEPQKDITPQEVALLIPIFSTAGRYLSKRKWIEMHNLGRHFIATETEEGNE